MRKIILAFFLLAAVFSCSEDLKSEEKELSDLNLYIKTNEQIDSVLISNITQDDFHMLPFADTLRINLKDSINDLYNVWFFANGKQYSSLNEQIWLDGKEVEIIGRFDNGLKIDTVYGSKLYYSSLKFRKDLSAIDSTSTNEFLLRELENRIASPFSREIANSYFFKNMSNISALKELYEMLIPQDSALKYHPISNYEQIEKIITLKKVDFQDFQFFDTGKNLSAIDLDKKERYLIDFWFVNCPPCIKDHKIMANESEFLHVRNVNIIGISTDYNHEKWFDFISEKKYPWKNYREIDDSEKRMTSKLAISLFPTYFLLDSQGNILFRTNSYVSVKEFLQ